MRRLASTAIVLALMTTVASAQTAQTGDRMDQNRTQAGSPAQIMTSLPNEAVTVTHWYKENVYDPNDSKIGEVKDVLVNHGGKIEAFIVAVGGFLGIGEQDVAVPFNAIHFTNKNNNKWYMVMNTTKDSMKAAPGLKYDRSAMTWIPENTPATTGAGTR